MWSCVLFLIPGPNKDDGENGDDQPLLFFHMVAMTVMTARTCSPSMPFKGILVISIAVSQYYPMFFLMPLVCSGRTDAGDLQDHPAACDPAGRSPKSYDFKKKGCMGGYSDMKGNGIAHGNYYKGQPNGK